MVIGNGMIANRFMDYKNDKDIIIFSSGVSNSKDIVEANFQREFTLLAEIIKNNPGKTLVYFSTCSIEDNDLALSPYVLHKKNIEKFIKQTIEKYYLFRVSNLAGISNNPYTILNYFIFNILSGHSLTVWKNASRNIISIDDMHSIINYFLREEKEMNATINIANTKNYSVPYIINCIEDHLNKKAICNEMEKGDNYKIDVSLIEPVISRLNIQFDDKYLPLLLKKYYHSK